MNTFRHTVPDFSKAATPKTAIARQWAGGIRICLFGYIAKLLVSLPFLAVAKITDQRFAEWAVALLLIVVAPILIYRVFHLVGFSLQPLGAPPSEG